jgi:hypothetical protein
MQPGSRPSGRWKFETEAEAAPVRAWWKVVWGPCTATNAIDGMADCAAARAPRQPCAFGAPLHPPEPFEDGAVQLWVKGGCRPQVDGTAGVSSTTELPYASRQLRLVPQAAISLHARGPDPQALGSVDNDDGLCPKPAYLQAPWIIGKRAFETDYCASLPGTAILAFKPRENPVNVG